MCISGMSVFKSRVGFTVVLQGTVVPVFCWDHTSYEHNVLL